MINQKGIGHIVFVIVVAVIAIIMVGVAWNYQEIAEDGSDVVVNDTSNATTNSVIGIDRTDWQTYVDSLHAYSIQYPGDYLIKTESNGYVVFDDETIDSPDTSYLHISVTVEDSDFHSYRLGILTDPAVDSTTIVEEDIVIDGLTGTKITLKNALGEIIIHHIVVYLGKVYDISMGDSADTGVIASFLESFDIAQLAATVDIADVTTFTGKLCASNNECGAYPCSEGTCLVKECTDDSECAAGTCGQYVTPVPGYCTTIDAL